MFIKSITLTNFRNHTHYHLDCQDDTTLILGKNGCGKTSVLEAIYILTRGKSFRASDPDIIKRETNFYRIELVSDTGEKSALSPNSSSISFLKDGSIEKVVRILVSFFFEESEEKSSLAFTLLASSGFLLRAIPSSPQLSPDILWK